MSLNAFVTLLTSDSYLPGALVALQSLLQAEGPNPTNPFETVCLVTPASLSVESIKALRRNYSLVVGVEELRSGGSGNLELLGRQDLASTLTKLQLFRLIQFKKVIFLDADTLVLSPLSHLFDLEAPFSAAPDSGWPDCFNSGMFVATPSSDTFDALVGMASERGSWDGGDQGLLNDYYTNWNRLSFTYNVTPSAYYTYAPAYRRHGDSIKVVHFIGQEKPWHQAAHRSLPSSATSSSSSVSNNGKAQHDYASLLDRWFAVYQKYFGTTSNATFTFPTLQAVWDAPSGRSGHTYTPPSLEELKNQFQGVIAMGGYKNNLSSSYLSQQAGLRSIEGHYVSMPLTSGRLDLLGARVFIPRVEKPAFPEGAAVLDRGASPAIPPTHIISPIPVKPEVAQPQHTSPPSQHQPFQQDERRSWSPANVSWDPALSEPPKNDRPQMEAGFNYQTENVWDSPRSSSSQRTFFKPPTQYGNIPSITHQNYDQITRSSPDYSKLKAVFPWEMPSSSSNSSGSSTYKASRVFPPELQRERMKLTPSRPAPPPPISSTSSPSSSRSHTPQQSSYHYDSHHHQPHDQHHRAHSGYDNQNHNGQHHTTTTSPVISDFANLSAAYGNAWDNVEGIKRYAKGLQGHGSRSSSTNGNSGKRQGSGGAAASGGSSRPSSSHHGHHSSSSSISHGGTSSPATSAAAAHPHAPTISSSHSRSASIQAGGNPRNSTQSDVGPQQQQQQQQQQLDHTRQRTISSTGSGYDTGGEASSRDGDDEDEDEEDDPIDRRMAQPIKFRNNSNNRASPGSAPSSTLPTSSASTGGTPRFQISSRSSSSETITRPHQASDNNSGGYTNLPDTSSGTYQPNRVSRVFDPSTATDVIRKEGLEALHRFVRSMEARGAAASSSGSVNGQDTNGQHAS